MSHDTSDYNLKAIRELLLAAFTAEDLRRFCLEDSRFRPICDRFGPNHGFDDMVDETIDYCRTHSLWPEFLAAVQEARPNTYATFDSRLRNSLQAGKQTVHIYGFVDSPPWPGSAIRGKVQIWGWANVKGSSVSCVEVWVDGTFRAEAAYGIPRPDAGGDYGFYWDWDTTQYADGGHILEVRVVATTGEIAFLPSAISRENTVHFEVKNTSETS